MIPRFIAICGAPGAGKSTVQRLLSSRLSVTEVDDKSHLRRAAMELFGLTWEQVSTQAGKREVVEVNGDFVTVRKLLGDLGCHLERTYGSNFFPERAVASVSDLPVSDHYCFASVRQHQGAYYQARGALLIEVRNEIAFIEHEFDRYDTSNIDAIIYNSPLTSEDDLLFQIESVLGLNTSSEPRANLFRMA